MSAPPPGPNATITRMVRAGQSCAGAGAANPAARAQAAKMARALSNVKSIVSARSF
jgi:hypothetical protein